MNSDIPEKKLDIAARKIYEAILEATGAEEAVVMVDFSTPNVEPTHMMLRDKNNTATIPEVLHLFRALIEDKASALAVYDRTKEGITLQ